MLSALIKKESAFLLFIYTYTPPHLFPKKKNLPVIPLPVRVACLRRHLLMYVPTAARVLLQIHRVLRHHCLAARRRGLGAAAVAPRATAAVEHVGEPGLRNAGREREGRMRGGKEVQRKVKRNARH